MKGKYMIGYAMTGSFCTVSKSFEALNELAKYNDILPIVSPAVASTDTRFGLAEDTLKGLYKICGREPVLTVKDAEPLGPRTPLDALIICPCTGNTLAKLAGGITDNSVTMAAKAHLRNGRPLVIALATNDGLSQSLKNIAVMLNRKNVYFVPMGQDDPFGKPSSLVADFSLLEKTLSEALLGRQLQPLLLR